MIFFVWFYFFLVFSVLIFDLVLYGFFVLILVLFMFMIVSKIFKKDVFFIFIFIEFFSVKNSLRIKNLFEEDFIFMKKRWKLFNDVICFVYFVDIVMEDIFNGILFFFFYMDSFLWGMDGFRFM